MTRERPLPCTAFEVSAFLAGAKTQLRRFAKTLDFIGGAGEEADPSKWGWFFDGPDHHGYMVLGRGHDERFGGGATSIPCPYGEVGDRIWIREIWTHDGDGAADARAQHEDVMSLSPIFYRAGMSDLEAETMHWRSPILMPRWASRITLEITEIRVQRVQDISEEDAIAEGVEPAVTARDGFSALWDSVNGRRSVRVPKPWPNVGRMTEIDTSASWESNPWIWALTVKRLP